MQSVTGEKFIASDKSFGKNIFICGKREVGRFKTGYAPGIVPYQLNYLRASLSLIYKKGNDALILSARDMTDAERKRYEKKEELSV